MPQIAIDSELGGCPDGLRQRYTEIAQKVGQWSMIFVDLAVGALGLFQGSVQDLLEDDPLFITKHRFQRVTRCKLVVHHPEYLGNVSRGKGGCYLLDQFLVHVLIAKNLSAT